LPDAESMSCHPCTTLGARAPVTQYCLSKVGPLRCAIVLTVRQSRYRID
jgi:hypothetical protein